MSARQHIVSPYRYALELSQAALVAAVSRAPSGPESSTTIGTTAKHGSAADPKPKLLHTYEVVVRGNNPVDNTKIAQRIADGLDAKYAYELEDDTLAGDLARSVTE